MVPRKMDHLFAGRRKQDDSPHGDRYKRTSINDSRHDYGNHSPSRSKRSSLPTQRYVSSLTKRKAILGSHDSRNDETHVLSTIPSDWRMSPTFSSGKLGLDSSSSFTTFTFPILIRNCIPSTTIFRLPFASPNTIQM